MATSVHSIQVAHSRVQDVKAARTHSNGGFAATLKQAGGAREDTRSSDAAAKDSQANTVVVDVDEPITNKAVADVVAKVVKGKLRADPETDASPSEMKQTVAGPEAEESLGEKEDPSAESKAAPDAPASNDAPIAVTYLAAGDARALRCNFSPSMLLATTDGTSPTDQTGVKARTSVDATELEKAAPPTGGELIFQLSLHSTPELPPTEAGRQTPANAGDAQGKSADTPELPSLPTENPAVVKTSVAAEVEKAATKPSASAERTQSGIPQEASRETPELSRDGMALQSVSTMPSHRTAATSNEHASPQSTTARPTEDLVPVAPQLRAPTALQRMDVILRGTDQVVRLDIRQSMGLVKVAVHSDDAALAVRLRDSLPELLNRLDDRGLQARVTSLGSQSQILPLARADSGNSAGKESDGWSRDTTRQQQQQQKHQERNQQRVWRAATWKLHEE